MKMILTLIALSSILFSSSAFSLEVPNTENMTVAQQDAFMTDVAKKIRRSYWVRSYDDVTSTTTFMTQALLDQHVKSSNRYEDFLGQDEVSDLYKCYYTTSCELYLVSVSSSYYSGYGIVAHFVLLDTKTQKYNELEHTIYAE